MNFILQLFIICALIGTVAILLAKALRGDFSIKVYLKTYLITAYHVDEGTTVSGAFQHFKNTHPKYHPLKDYTIIVNNNYYEIYQLE